MLEILRKLEEKVYPSHTALIVVDMQNDFCAKGGVLDREGHDLSRIQSMTPRLIKFIDKARETRIPVIHVQMIFGLKNKWYISDVGFEQHARMSSKRFIQYSICEQDSWGADFFEGFEPLLGEFLVRKHRYSAFVGTDLDLILKSRGIRTLIMTGISTNVCVESTARDGFMRDYYIVLVKDCTAASSEEDYNCTLRNITRFFGEVVDSSDVLKCWESSN